MKNKIVIWGNDAADKKILIGIELKAEDNKVNIYTFGEELATEELYNQMMDVWRSNKELDFPEGHKLIERPLSMTDDLLPKDIKVQRADLITRAKAEWHFAVLSAKLFEMYHAEIEDFKEKVDGLTEFDITLWNELTGYWDKLSNQIRERNLLREEANTLRDKCDALFEQLKVLRKKANEEFSKLSKEKFEDYKERLININEKIEKGLGLKPIFEELKTIQNQFKNDRFTKNDRNKLWKNIDILFKKVKEKKYGKSDSNTSGNQMTRLERRHQGLLDAISKMEKSIERDQRDIDFQKKRVGETDGQLEAQIRQAKVKMIESRIVSKQEKLSDMLATKVDIEKREESEKQKAIKNQEKQELKKKEQELKEKIATEIEEKAQSLDADKLEAAAQAIRDSRKPRHTSSNANAIPSELNINDPNIVDDSDDKLDANSGENPTSENASDEKNKPTSAVETTTDNNKESESKEPKSADEVNVVGSNLSIESDETMQEVASRLSDYEEE